MQASEVSGRGAGVYLADTGQKVVYATLDMLRDDATLSIMDWGANYVEEDYAEAGGNPYDPAPLAVGDLASYDARERAERAQVTDELGDTIGRLDAADDDVLVSNVAYYVAQSAESAETLLMLGLRLAAGFSPLRGAGRLCGDRVPAVLPHAPRRAAGDPPRRGRPHRRAGSRFHGGRGPRSGVRPSGGSVRAHARLPRAGSERALGDGGGTAAAQTRRSRTICARR